MQVEMVPIGLLVPDPHNTRLHGEKNLKAIKGSVNLFGVVEPLVVQRGTNLVIGGNGRLEVLKKLGHETVPVNYVDLSDSKAKALSQALNRTAELAEWDMDALGSTLQSLREDGLDLLEIGFDTGDWEMPDFKPATEEDQGKLDEKAKVICPACNHEFTN
jgi:ParB-like chromosome segregation protein Spo0J